MRLKVENVVWELVEIDLTQYTTTFPRSIVLHAEREVLASDSYTGRRMLQAQGEGLDFHEALCCLRINIASLEIDMSRERLEP